ncbi:hypothetical protein AB4254_08320 [Vibrio breoganii]
MLSSATVLTATSIKVECPHCGGRLDGFLDDPRGSELDCDHCHQTFEIHPDADIELIL